MPPAFNLSQDQTLQFNLRQELILTFGSNDLRFAPRVLGPASFSASTTKFRAPGRFRRRFSAAGFPATSSPAGCPGDLTPSTHTYRLFTLLKSRRPREKHLGRREARLYRTLGSGQQSRRAPVAWSASRGASKAGPTPDCSPRKSSASTAPHGLHVNASHFAFAAVPRPFRWVASRTRLPTLQREYNTPWRARPR